MGANGAARSTPARRVCLTGAGWPTGYRSVVVRGARARADPYDVLAVVCALASRMLNTPGIGSGQVTCGPESAETVGLTQTELTALTRHRLLRGTSAR